MGKRKERPQGKYRWGKRVVVVTRFLKPQNCLAEFSKHSGKERVSEGSMSQALPQEKGGKGSQQVP